MTKWIKSSYSADTAACLEVAHEDHKVLVRDSKFERRGEVSPVIEFTPSGWRSFLIVAAEWDRETTVSASGVTISTLRGVPENVCLIDTSLRHLHFSWDEWDAFVKGAAAGEFLPEADGG